MPGAVWFPGASLNYAEHALRGDDRAVAVVSRSQTRGGGQLTFAELRDQVARARAGLQRLGVTRGDRVAAYLPTITESVVAFLATASLGAVWSSCAPEFGTRSVVDRFAQIAPKVLLAVDGYRYGRPRRRSAGRGGVHPGLPADPGGHRGRPLPGPGRWSAGRGGLGRPARRAGTAGLRRRRLRSPALRPLLVGNHRPAQSHRARPRRHPPRALEGPWPACRHRGRRPLRLVHDHRLDDVELPRLGTARRRHHRALRRRPGPSRPARPVATGRRDRADLPRRQRPFHHGMPKGRPPARVELRPHPSARRRLDRRAAAGGRASGGSTRRWVPIWSSAL